MAINASRWSLKDSIDSFVDLRGIGMKRQFARRWLRAYCVLLRVLRRGMNAGVGLGIETSRLLLSGHRRAIRVVLESGNEGEQIFRGVR